MTPRRASSAFSAGTSISRVVRVGDSSRALTTTMTRGVYWKVEAAQCGAITRVPPRRGVRIAFGRAGGAAALTARATFKRPNPKTGLGTIEPEKPPQSCVEVSGTAVRFNRSIVVETCPMSCGAADQRRATAPLTCGADPEVPEKLFW